MSEAALVVLCAFSYAMGIPLGYILCLIVKERSERKGK
jgi:hypothetical protein